MADSTESAAMERAIELSARAQYTTPPNPDVGCVVLDRDGRVAGVGWHERAGGPHAEVVALQTAGAAAQGGTLVVTLEPCDHDGRTPPCSRAVINAGIARVVYAVKDPNDVAAGGAATLRAHGISVEGGVLTDQAARVNARWLTPFRTHRPFVTWKYAATLDGRSAAADRSSKWITSSQARADVHLLRASVDTIVVGVGTVLADDPELTARTGEDVEQPLRVVVDSGERTPFDATVRNEAAKTWLATVNDVGPDDDHRVNLHKLLDRLHAEGRRYVLLEGGPTLAGAFWQEGLVDRVVAYVAPALLGAGPHALGFAGVTTIDDAVRLDVTDVTTVGPDVRITAVPAGRT